MVFDHFDERFKEVPMQEFCLFASDMRVRMLVRASMHATSCMLLWPECAHGLVLVVASSCWHVCLRQYLCLHPYSSTCFLYVRFVQDCVCVSAGSSPASSPGYVQGVMSKVVGYQRIFARARALEVDCPTSTHPIWEGFGDRLERFWKGFCCLWST